MLLTEVTADTCVGLIINKTLSQPAGLASDVDIHQPPVHPVPSVDPVVPGENVLQKKKSRSPASVFVGGPCSPGTKTVLHNQAQVLPC